MAKDTKSVERKDKPIQLSEWFTNRAPKSWGQNTDRDFVRVCESFLNYIMIMMIIIIIIIIFKQSQSTIKPLG